MLASLISNIMDRLESSAPLDIIDLTGDSPVSSLRHIRRTVPNQSVVTNRERRLAPARRSIMEIPSSSERNEHNSMVEILDDTMSSLDILMGFNRLHPSHPTVPSNRNTSVSRTRRQPTTTRRSRTQGQLLTQQENNGSVTTNVSVPNVAPYINDTVDDVPVPLTCPICFEILSSTRKPTSTRCGHVFCAECLNSSLRSNNKCPKCKNKIIKNSCIRLYF